MGGPLFLQGKAGCSGIVNIALSKGNKEGWVTSALSRVFCSKHGSEGFEKTPVKSKVAEQLFQSRS